MTRILDNSSQWADFEMHNSLGVQNSNSRRAVHAS